LTLPLLEEVLEVAQGFVSEENQIQIVSSIIPCLVREGNSSRAFSLAQSLTDNRWRAVALADTLRYLPDPMQNEVLREVKAILVEGLNTEHRVEIMVKILPYFENDRHTDLEAWRGLLYSFTGRDRKDLLLTIGQLLPLPLPSPNVESAANMAEAIRDVGRWWP